VSEVSQLDPSGTATSALGFRAGAVYAGIKTYGEGKLDVAILASDRPAAVAGMFTKARLHAPAVDIDRERIAGGVARAVVVNAGIANASTGERGRADGIRMTELAAAKLGIDPAHVLVCSTGVIGHFLPMDKIEDGISRIALDAGFGHDFARAIMTTDTRPKHAAVRFGPYTIGGCAKGAGMIHPNMATMLAFLATDAPVDQPFLQDALRQAVDRSFNCVSIDGDTSPSDTVLLFANGAAGGETITAGSALAPAFAAALESLCVHLAKEIARDGEGATRLVEFRVTGAASDADAHGLVSLLSTSYLLKSAIHGADPNWGRIIAVIGRSTAAYNEDDVAVSICGQRVFEHQRPTVFDPAAVSASLGGDTVTIEVSLGDGPGSATGWTCDLSEEYVTINADYHT
jgi:glutamate N-acetyltransferase/amino-acid N-acetyltransferase